MGIIGLMLWFLGHADTGFALRIDQDFQQPDEQAEGAVAEEEVLSAADVADAAGKTEAVPAPAEKPQDQPAVVQTENETSFSTTGTDEDKKYVLQKGDRVDVKVFPDDEYVRGGEQNISEEGNVRITTAGKVQVAGMTILTAEAEINKILQDYFVEPEASIEVLDSEEKSIVILGEVQKPGTYPMPVGKFRFTLMEAIAMAGGFSEIANIKRITVTRKAPDGENLRISANAEEIIQGTEEDVNLQPDDIIHVKESFF